MRSARKLLYLGGRLLHFNTKKLFAIVFVLTIAMGILCAYNLMGMHLSWRRSTPPRTRPINRHDHQGALLREEYQKIPFIFYDTPQMEDLRPVLEPYIKELDTLRKELIKKPYVRYPLPDKWTLIDAYNQDYFNQISEVNGVHTVFLSADLDKAKHQLPVREFFDFAGTEFGCERMMAKCWAIYNNGDVLLNKTCQTNLTRTLVSFPADRTILSVGLPFSLKTNESSPTGHPPNEVIFTFMNVIENAVISGNGEVFVNNVCIKTQRCTSAWYNIESQTNIDTLPFYEEVLTITEQTQVWYYHATIEDLTRIAPYLSFLHDHPSIKIHITRADFHIKMLTFLGISAERLIWGAVRAKIVFLPAGTTCGRPGLFNTGLLSLQFHQRVAARLGNFKRDRIVIIRRADKKRQFYHHNDIVTMVTEEAAPYNIVVEVFRDDPTPTLETYIELFQHAKLVIAPHGAGISNQLFTQPGTVIIEGLCYMEPWRFFCFLGYIPWLCHRDTSRFSLSFRNLATMLGNHYHGIVRQDDCLHVTPDDLREPVQFYLKHFGDRL